MQREWYLIDDDGIHPLDVDDKPDDFWEQFDRTGDDAPWPEFNQLVVDASPTRTVEALHRSAPQLGMGLDDVTEEPERWDQGLVITEAGDGLTAIGEPGVDLDERAMALPWTKQLVAELRCDGAFFGYDRSAGTLHLAMFSNGATDFAWCDSLVPGPSYAMEFDEQGRSTDEDPRKFALRKLGMPESSPLLDRYGFVIAHLEQLGLETISPELHDLPVAAVLLTRAVEAEQDGA